MALPIGVVGEGVCSRRTAREAVGTALAAGAIVVCGGLKGVMEAASRGDANHRVIMSVGGTSTTLVDETLDIRLSRARVCTPTPDECCPRLTVARPLARSINGLSIALLV
jgi:predicted Rossmann-fold nucleotide-binding protein